MNSSHAGYGWNTSEAPHTCAYLLPEVLATLGRVGSKRILDLGSGNGNLSRRLADLKYDVVGVERDGEGIDRSRLLAPKVPFHQYAVEDDPSLLMRGEAPFDTVISTEVIEHLFSPALLPRYAHAVLEAGGHLIVTTPYHGYVKNLALSLADKWDHHHTVWWEGGHIKFFSRATLTQLLQDNGFDVVDFNGVGRLPWLWKSMIVTARKRA
jgi:2-polyprenyl-3-methyl-5-hydroxy-6-metoxy-1,4-benzoquinol methylase